MFGPKIVKPQTKSAASTTSTLVPQRSTLVARPFGGGAIEQVHTLQQTIGSQTTLRYLTQQPSSLPAVVHEALRSPGQPLDAATPAYFEPRFGYSFGQVLTVQPPQGAIQPKLAVGEVDNPLENEADRVADQVMRMPDPVPPATAQVEIGLHCKGVARREEQIQTKPAGTPNAAAGEAPAVVHEVLRSPGQPLDAATRAYFEPRFGHSFGHVRVHTDERAAKSATSIGATAYTAGSDISFAASRYHPATPAGRRLLAHELTHVVQQSAERVAPMLQCKEENNSSLARIQGLPMQELLPLLNKLPMDALVDEEAGGFVGGPRLVIAMRAARAKIDRKIVDFLANNREELQALPPDQAVDILNFVGKPSDLEPIQAPVVTAQSEQTPPIGNPPQQIPGEEEQHNWVWRAAHYFGLTETKQEKHERAEKLRKKYAASADILPIRKIKGGEIVEIDKLSDDEIIQLDKDMQEVEHTPLLAAAPSAPPGWSGALSEFGKEIEWPTRGKVVTPAEEVDLVKVQRAGVTEQWATEEAKIYRGIARKVSAVTGKVNPTAELRADWLEKVAARLRGGP